VILYELMTSRRPFEGSAAEVLGKILYSTPLPPSAHRAGIDPALEAICLKATAKDATERYTSMDDFAMALDSYLTRAPVSPTTPIGSAQSASVSRREQSAIEEPARQFSTHDSFAGCKAGELKRVALDSIDLVFCWCPAGKFKMGSPPDEAGRAE